MRGFSYSAILGATLIFIAVVSSLLWAVIYRRFNEYISIQMMITIKSSYLSVNNFSTTFLSIKNVSGFNVNLTNTSKIYLYPYINNEISREDLPWSVYQYQGHLVLKYYIPLNVSLKNTGNIKDFEIKNLYLPETTSIQGLELNKFFNQTELTPYKITIDQMFNNLSMLGTPFYDVLTNILKDNYSNLNPTMVGDVCDELSPISSISPSTSFFYNSGKLSYVFISGVFIRNKEQCLEVLDVLEQRIKDQVFLRNCPNGDCMNNPGVFLIPYNITIIFTKKHVTGELVCSSDGSVESAPKTLSEDAAKYLCKRAVELKNDYCIVKENELKNDLSSCGSPTKLSNFIKCAKAIVGENIQMFGISGCILENCLNTNFFSCVKECFKRCFDNEIKLNLDFYYYSPRVYVKYMVYDTNYVSTSEDNPNRMYILYFKTEKIYNLPPNFL